MRGSPPRRRNLKSERTQPPVGSYDPRTQLSLRSLGPKDSRASLGGVSASLSLPDVRLVSNKSSPSPSPERSQLWRTHQDSSTRFGRRADSRSRTAGKLHASKAADKVSSMYVMFPSFLLCVVFARWLERMFSCTTHTRRLLPLLLLLLLPNLAFLSAPSTEAGAPLARAPSCGPFARLLLSTACLSLLCLLQVLELHRRHRCRASSPRNHRRHRALRHRARQHCSEFCRRALARAGQLGALRLVARRQSAAQAHHDALPPRLRPRRLEARQVLRCASDFFIVIVNSIALAPAASCRNVCVRGDTEGSGSRRERSREECLI